jgi:hypothetical protein
MTHAHIDGTHARRSYMTDFDCSNVTAPAVHYGRCQPVTAVGEVRLDSLSDEERETHIRDCGRHMRSAMQAWEEHGNFADHGEACYWRRLMEQAISQRSPAQIARMRAAQAQKMAREPGAERLA